MRTSLILVAVLLVSSLPSFAFKEETVEELIARAEAARPEERPPLYTEIAKRKLKAADQLYNAGQTDQARATVNDVVNYCGKATDAATQSGKHLKHTEISVRKMAAKLRDIQRSLNFEDQAPIKAAVEQLENLRTALLSRMFGGKNKK
ncbi:MAG TPA: hypothetical protein VMT28_00360 [Terriglobales bacterium]|jgi:hypothetical protein|nr:hypothetical protein [Terriglobales bacterium]